MFTDIEGSTSLTSRLGDVAAQRVVDARHSVVRTALARHGGREHDEAGDGLMVTFDSARQRGELRARDPARPGR